MPAPSVPGTPLRQTAERIVAGEDRLVAVRDFLDQVPRRTSEELATMIEEEPQVTGDGQADALLAAIAEHVAIRHDLGVPRWALQQSRFLDRFWFVSPTRGFRAIALVQTPIALKRRGIFWPERSMERV